MVNGANVWVPSAATGAIGPGEVHVWRVGLIQPDLVIQRYRALLAEKEVEQADRFYFDKDRNRYTVARGVLRLLLGACLQLDPRVISFVYGPQGKPSLAEPQSSSGLRFNVSHSGEVALLAISRNLELGVDVEQIRSDFANKEIAARFFAPEECAKLETVAVHESADAFFNCWTRKEAYIKARGQGLSIPLDSFEVAFMPGEEPALLQVKSGDDSPSRWHFHALHPGPGYKAALAVEGNDYSLQLWEWTTAPAADGRGLLRTSPAYRR